MKGLERAAVVGLGLVGGSIARDLAAHGVKVSGFDADDAQLDAAVRSGVVDRRLDADLGGVADADVVILAVPVDAAVDLLERLAPHVARSTLVTDVGSTKARIVRRASELGIGRQFVGSHPMAGDHRSGWDASRAGLFRGARVYLCPTPTAEGVERAAELWKALGARPEPMDAAEHDRVLAWTSHLPHVVATAIALALDGAGFTRADLGPGGRDVTRLAGSSPEMWSAIARENAIAIDEALAAAERELARFRTALGGTDAAPLHAQFTSARAWFER